MLTITQYVPIKIHCITIEDLVPENHLVRQIDRLVDFSFIYPLVENLYCKDNGKPSIDPVILVKYILLVYLFGIPSERRIQKEIEVNMAHRWFLGLDLLERVPYHSTVSQNRKRRFNGTNLFRSIFENILLQCMEKALVKGNVILTDSTHIKASTSKTSEINVLVEKESYAYMDRLDYYEKLERKRLEEKGMKPKQTRKQNEAKDLVEKTISKTDPEAGYLKRRGKPLGMHYLSHESVDSANGIVVDVAVTSGNVNDATVYLDRIDYMKEKFKLKIKAVGVDSGYDKSLIHQVLSEQNLAVYTPNKRRGKTYSVEFTEDCFEYDSEKDVFVCLGQKELTLRNLKRSEYNIMRVYKADRKDCKVCNYQDNCVAKSNSQRIIRVNIFKEAVEKGVKLAETGKHTEVLNLRQVWCEGSFAAQKREHNLARLQRRGLEAAEDHCLLSATTLNLKRMVRCIG